MFNLKKSKKSLLVGVCLMTSVLVAASVSAGSRNHRLRITDFSYTAKITDFKKTMVFLTSAPFDSVDGSFVIDGIVGGDGLHFQKEIMGRTDKEIEENRQEAIDYFKSQFGVDATDPDRILFTGFEALPDLKYRVVVSSGEFVHKKGWRINDGGWIAVVTDPNGYDLGGEHAGVNVPAGTMFAFGDYRIDKTFQPRRAKKHIYIKYRSQSPILFNPNGSFGVSCQLFHEKWGEGLANGQALPRLLPNGQYAFNTRLVITFSALGESIDAVNP